MAEGWEPRPLSDIFGNQVYLSGQTLLDIFRYTKNRGGMLFSSDGNVSGLLIGLEGSTGIGSGYLSYNQNMVLVEGIISIQTLARIYSFRISSDGTLSNVKSVALS